ncbi:MAG TPA: EAL domain-containing protein [Noviherbaspirillum sp.]|jgi:diguanylate cyclase (GGDEF)-like protein/PAS domain S-box-containing protein|uniref:bifunctional diguanylate cyclase/phosphodiesterase n=1 Tax=Noviherbaspirillum sp. TaxID=1926288 RepID=UPI002F9421CA
MANNFLASKVSVTSPAFPAVPENRFRLLAEALERIGGQQSRARILDTMRIYTRHLVGANGACIVLRDQDQCYYVAEDSPEGALWRGQRFPMASCISGWVMLHRRTAVVTDVLRDSRVPPDIYRPTYVKSMVMVPVGGDRPFAAIGAYWSALHHPAPDDIAVLEALARACGAALRQCDAYEQLRESEERFRNLLEVSPDGLLINVGNRFAYANQAALTLLRASAADQVVGRSVFDFILPAYHRQARERIMRALAGLANPLAETGMRALDGTSIDAETAAGPAHWNGMPAVQVLMRDVGARRRSEEKLRRSEASHRIAIEAGRIGTWDLDLATQICVASPRMLAMLNLHGSPGTFAMADWIAVLRPEDGPALQQALADCVGGGAPLDIEYRVRDSEGGVRWLYSRGALYRDSAGVPARVHGATIDITARKDTEEALRISNERLNLAVKGAGEGVWDWDFKRKTRHFSARAKEILGYADNEIDDADVDWSARIHPDDMPRVEAAFADCLDGKTPTYICEYRVRTRDDRWKWVLSRGILASRDADGKPQRFTGMVTDISERKQADELIWRHANFDALTGLPNRRLFRDRLDRAVTQALRTDQGFALLFIDLDRFKEINDLLGHDTGDLLLVQAAQRIRGCVRDADTVARLGGDEFTVILAQPGSAGQTEQVAQKILAALTKPFMIGREVAYISASIGITMCPTDASAPEELIRKADQAMYAAKHGGKNRFSYFTLSMDEKAQRRLRLANELRGALRANQLSVYFQPVLDLQTGQVVKAEALLRWHHPQLGNVDPAQFIPLAEETGTINAIGDWVFREAAAWAQRWSSKLGTPFQVGVNKSPVQFLAQEEEGWVAYLQRIGVSPQHIAVEITEGLLLNTSGSVSGKLFEYRDAGIQVAIDDFGTGYSSMAYLKKFDIDYLKIDRSFVRDMAADEADRTIAESIIVMAHRLGLKVIAEGVESREQMDLLAAAGCDYGQGFLFSRPLPAADFEQLLLSRQGRGRLN